MFLLSANINKLQLWLLQFSVSWNWFLGELWFFSIYIYWGNVFLKVNGISRVRKGKQEKFRRNYQREILFFMEVWFIRTFGIINLSKIEINASEVMLTCVICDKCGYSHGEFVLWHTTLFVHVSIQTLTLELAGNIRT